MKVGKISYLNTLPFFFKWPVDAFPVLSGSPRELAQRARQGQLVAGPLPIVECWNLEKDYEPLGLWGISAGTASRSVFVLSKVPFSELNGGSINVTTESSSSVALCKTLIENRFGHSVNIKRGFSIDDQARLIIGDAALKIWNHGSQKDWPFITDLATEWWEWKSLPFVFARWIVRKDVAASFRGQLENQVKKSLKEGLSALSEIGKTFSPSIGISPKRLEEYLKGFVYQLGPSEIQSLTLFRKLYEKENQERLAYAAISPSSH